MDIEKHFQKHEVREGERGKNVWTVSSVFSFSLFLSHTAWEWRVMVGRASFSHVATVVSSFYSSQPTNQPASQPASQQVSEGCSKIGILPR